MVTRRSTDLTSVRSGPTFFSDGISEEITNALGQIEGLRVAARSSSVLFKGKSIQIGDIARRLDVHHVLEGSVREAGTRVRVIAQLVNAANGFSSGRSATIAKLQTSSMCRRLAPLRAMFTGSFSLAPRVG